MPKSKVDRNYLPVFEKLGFDPVGESGGNHYGDCPFCGKSNKFYVNRTTGQYQCKSASCGSEGNIYNFLNQSYEMLWENHASFPWEDLSEHKNISVELLKHHGLVYEHGQWIIPVRNEKGTMVNLLFYDPQAKKPKPMGLTGMGQYLIGLDLLHKYDPKCPIYLTEGKWDQICLQELLGTKGVAIGVPGANSFRDEWIKPLEGRNVVICYDNDIDGEKGGTKAASKLLNICPKVKKIYWPEGLPDGFDIRDFYKSGQPLKELKKFIKKFRPEDDLSLEEVAEGNPIDEYPLLSSGKRPPLEEIIDIYRKYLFFTQTLIDALRCIFAVVISNQLEGCPLWLFIAGPPGYGKSELLTSTSEVTCCVNRSTVSRPTLVSGWKVGKDPSLIPKLIGKTLILKDFTEVLQMGKQQKEEVYAVLRGAFDGKVERDFGSGIMREYTGQFTMAAGVTNVLFAESNTTMGERSLTFRLPEMNSEHENILITAAISNSGKQVMMKEVLHKAAKSFLEYKIKEEDYPLIPVDYVLKIVALSRVVAYLRAAVDRDPYKDTILYQPMHELGSRIAIQLHKLMVALALQRYPAEVTEDDFRVIRKVALDSCSEWNLKIINVLVERDGLDLNEIAKLLATPKTTVKLHVDDLVLLKVIRVETHKTGEIGRPVSHYYLEEEIKDLWVKAGFEIKTTAPIEVEVKNDLNGHVTPIEPITLAKKFKIKKKVNPNGNHTPEPDNSGRKDNQAPRIRIKRMDKGFRKNKI